MSEAYREKALNCLLAADQVRDPEERFRLLQIAQLWMTLAQHVAARDHRMGSESDKPGRH